MTKHPASRHFKPGPGLLNHRAQARGPGTGSQEPRAVDMGPRTFDQLLALPGLSWLGLVLLGPRSVDQRQGVTVRNRYS